MEQNFFADVIKNQYGFYELKSEFRKEMKSFYEDVYYQSDKALYKKIGYSEEELSYKNNLFREKEFIYTKIIGEEGESFIDVGCGEGYAMKYFYKKGWNVCGIDFSDYGIKAHNPDMNSFLIKGDLIKTISCLDRKFSFINMDNVLEHLPSAKDFLSVLKLICEDDAIICITVPNDFSITQQALFQYKDIDKAFFVTKDTSEHFNYFTIDSLVNFVEKNGFEIVWKSADYPIDFNLFNPRTNYIKNKEVGHDGHVARLKVENMLYDNSLENTVNLHKAYAECGIGRDISIYMKIRK